MQMVKREKRRVLGRFGAVTGVLLVLTLVLSGCGSLLGSSDNDDEETYAVTVGPSGAESDESVSADVSEAAEGDTVTLTASLNSDREVTLTSDASGITIDPTTITTDGGTATFTMPATDVTVNATFSTQVPDNVPDDDSAEAITGDSYDNLELEWSGDVEDGGGYLAAIYLNSGGANPAENYDYIETDLFDDTNDQDIDAGTYSYSEVDFGEADYGSNGTFTNFTVLADFNGQPVGNGAAADYAASTVTESELADAGVDTDSHDLITDGTITVSKDGAIYTIEWDMTTEGGETLAGSYEGEVDHVFEEGSE